ncbi:MAG: DUF4160 domain-containing protein [Planctomycetes bacterium]|nr:DUF4160 domain-containing protein [Planctomycetota bacterium]
MKYGINVNKTLLKLESKLNSIENCRRKSETEEPSLEKEDRKIQTLIKSTFVLDSQQEDFPHEVVDLPTKNEWDGVYDFSLEPDKVGINREQISADIKEKGIEAIAWYKPFHTHDADEWGIYYDAEGIYCFAEEVFGVPVDTNIFRKTIALVRNHELFHFLVEMMCTSLELSDNKAYYLSYQSQKAQINNLEESLATAIQFNRFNWVKGRKGSKKKLETMLKDLPDGYRAYANYIADTNFREGLSSLIKTVVGDKVSDDTNNIFFNTEPFIISSKDVPEYILTDKSSSAWLKYGIPFPVFNGCKVNIYPGDHAPPHIHVFMPSPDYERGSYLVEPPLASYRNSPILSDKELKKIKSYISKYSDKISKALRNTYRTIPEKQLQKFVGQALIN